MSHTNGSNRRRMGKRGRLPASKVHRVNQLSANRLIPGIPHIDEDIPAQLGHGTRVPAAFRQKKRA